MIIRPGPAAIPAGEYPGGVVIHVYDVPAGVLLSTSYLRHGDDLEADAERAGNQVGRLVPPGRAVVLVAYDGDTGERFTSDAWRGLVGRG